MELDQHKTPVRRKNARNPVGPGLQIIEPTDGAVRRINPIVGVSCIGEIVVDVSLDECRLDTALRGPLPCLGDGGSADIDTRYHCTDIGQTQRVETRIAHQVNERTALYIAE